ncbi:ankyrin repeat-containing domain protein [Aspergillus crustosus]
MAGHEEMVGFLLDAGACPNTDYDQYSPLGWAVESGNAKIVRLLLERGADPEAEDPRQGSLLGPPIRGGAYTIVELLLDAGLTPDPAVLSDYESPPLVTALRCCQDDVAFLLIERGANLNPGGDPHVSTLAWAVRNGNLRLLEYMLEKGADVDAGVEGGETPLMVAAMNGRAEFIKPLLDGGASFSLTNSQGQTALGIAVQRGWFDVAAAILDINFRTGLGFDTPEESGLFIVNDANTQTIIDKPDILGRTPLFHATVSGRQDLVALLLTHGSTAINTSTCAERSPWLVAQQWVDRNTWDIPDTQCNTIRDLFADVQEPAAVLARGPMIQMAALDPAKLKYPDAPRLDLPCSYPDAARLDLWPHVNPWRRCNLCKTRLGKRGEHFVWDSYRRVGFQVCLECMIKRRGKVCLIW